MIRLPIKCSEPMLLAKREAPTGIQCIFLELDFKMNLQYFAKEGCHLDARKKPATLPRLLLRAASSPVAFQSQFNFSLVIFI